MTEKKKKQEEDNSQIRLSEDNFANFFLKVCEKYDVSPLPKVISSGVSSERPESRQKSANIDDDSAPIIIMTYGNPKTLENPDKFQCNGFQVSVCMLDALNVSVKKFQTLSTISLPNCGINAFGITQIAEILTEIGCIRDLKVDLNPNIRENYDLLCTPLGKLEYLSLKYCNITDTGVERIATALKRNNTTEIPQLIAMDLSNNFIQDIGARHIADMLHTNRSLQSINLTGNRITDFGAGFIIKQLNMHSLTHDEIVELRRLNYRRLRESKPFNIFHDSSSHERSSTKLSSRSKQKTSRRSITSSKSVNSRQSIGASYAANKEREWIHFHPLNRESQPIEGEIIATGNFELQHLNLSYNHLSDESLKTIADCILYQTFMIEDTNKGLLHVCLEGNDFRYEENEHVRKIKELLNQRRSPKSQVSEQQFIEALVSPKARILRDKLRILENTSAKHE